MAAHLKTGLEQCLQAIDEGKFDVEWIRPAVDLSCWTEDNTDVWLSLYLYVQGSKSLKVLDHDLAEHLANATDEWEALGRPETREEWNREKYKEFSG